MVFGLFEKGKIEIELNKFNFTSGDTIEGKIKLQLKKQVKARGLFVTIFAEETTQNANIGRTTKQPMIGHSTSISVGGIGSTKTTQRAFEFKQQVDGEKEYFPTEQTYDFVIKVPTQSVQQKTDNPMSGIVDTIKLFTIGNQYTKWFIEAKLDISKGLDVSKKVQINIT